jgi:hypothetical protein
MFHNFSTFCSKVLTGGIKKGSRGDCLVNSK